MMIGVPATSGPALSSRASVLPSVTPVLASTALVVTDASMVNVALPTIAEALEVTPAIAVRIVSAYQLALLMLLLPIAKVGEAFGYRRVFVVGLLTFSGAAALSASAPTLEWLVAARFVQGIGGAAIMALGVALLRQALTEARFAAAIGWNALTVALCSAAGPPIAAMLLSLAGWPGLFLMHVPLALLALLSSRALPGVAGTGGRLDLPSMGLSMAGFASFLLGLGAVADDPSRAALMIASAAGLFWILSRRELRSASPMVPVDLLRVPGFRLSVIASVCCFVAQTLGILALPFYLQHDIGLTVAMTGLLITPWPIAVALSALVSGRLADRFPSLPLTAAGTALLGLGLGAVALAPTEISLPALALLTVLCGLGFGLFQVPNNRNLFLAAPVSRSSAAGGIQGTARLTGQAVGAVIAGLVFASVAGSEGPKLALAAGAAFALAASAVAAWQALQLERSASAAGPIPS